MPHEITQRADGTAEAAYSIRPAWHGLGHVSDTPMDSAETIKRAQLDWDVVPAHCWGVVEDPDTLDTHHIAADGYRIMVRGDNQAVLGVVSRGYPIVQNRDAFKALDTLAMDGIVRYEAAFSLYGGKRVVIVARLPGDVEVADGDTILRYLMLATSHTGDASLTLIPTAVRVVCSNTEALAMRKAQGALLRIVHRGNMQQKLTQAVAGVQAAVGMLGEWTTWAMRMVEQSITDAQFVAMRDKVAPMPDRGTDRQVARVRNVRQWMQTEYHAHPTQGTAWGAFNAASSWAEHGRTFGKQQTRFTSATMGGGAQVKQAAWQACMEMVGT